MNNDARPRDTLIHIADIHFWKIVRNPSLLFNKRFFGNFEVLFRRSRTFDMTQAEPYADAVAKAADEAGANTVLLTGDFVSTAMEEEFELAVRFVRGLHERGLQINLLPGNHDVYTYESVRRKRFQQFFGEFLPPAGYPAVTRMPGGTPLILVPTVRPRPFTARGYVSEKEIDQVRQLLAQTGDRVVVGSHYPVLHHAKGYASTPLRRLQNAGKLRRVLGESQKHILYAAGHVHAFSYERDNIYPNVEHLTTGAFFKRDIKHGVAGEFTEIKVYPDRFEILHHIYKGAWTTAKPVIHYVDKSIQHDKKVE